MALLSEALEIAIEIGDRQSKAFTLHDLAIAHQDQHDHLNAVHHYEQAADIYREVGHPDEAFVLETAADLRRLIDQEAP